MNASSQSSTVSNSFHVEPPVLPEIDATLRQIDRSVTHQVIGRVAAVTGETLELEGMAAPLGAICELMIGEEPKRQARVIGFLGVRPILAPLETVAERFGGRRSAASRHLRSNSGRPGTVRTRR